MVNVQDAARMLIENLSIDGLKKLYDVLDAGKADEVMDELGKEITKHDPTFFPNTEGK